MKFFPNIIADWWYRSPVPLNRNVDIVIYSYNRPMQLYALLESIYHYMSGIGEICVIYRASDDRYESGYKIVKNDFPKISYLRQGNDPKQDFQPLTLDAVYNSPNLHLMFAVDDIIVKDVVDLTYCAKMLACTGAYGFYLRLGKNINYSYANDRFEKIPNLVAVEGDVYSWMLGDGECEWRYANTVDMTIYHKKDIRRALYNLCYENPNTFEGHWSTLAYKIMHRKALCFEYSKIVNIPLNLVQNVCNNRHMGAYTSDELLELFEKGFRIDIHDFYKIQNNGPHMDYQPHFVMLSGEDNSVVKDI